ncbi:hypothetical protein BDY21DRAFT_47732 [Lineolata rhizophorae]|uniref:Uncharacterized protein n=1 Tax=Lineolata rhizophorae TaxID=578093 RepID=A0A6A6NXL9_9PEZI|nr:hypothetical protein BDY21DRAFT_47732 [Lineolata rhizophorae]
MHYNRRPHHPSRTHYVVPLACICPDRGSFALSMYVPAASTREKMPSIPLPCSPSAMEPWPRSADPARPGHWRRSGAEKPHKRRPSQTPSQSRTLSPVNERARGALPPVLAFIMVADSCCFPTHMRRSAVPRPPPFSPFFSSFFFFFYLPPPVRCRPAPVAASCSCQRRTEPNCQHQQVRQDTSHMTLVGVALWAFVRKTRRDRPAVIFRQP